MAKDKIPLPSFSKGELYSKRITELIGGRLIGDNVLISGIANPSQANSGDLAVLLYRQQLKSAFQTKASCLLIDLDTAAHHASSFPCSLIVVENIGEALLQIQRSDLFTTDTSVEIGEGTHISPNCVIMPGSKIGKNVILQPGCVIGADAFVYVGHRNTKIRSMGTVEIGDNVEIGANTCVDRALFGKTIIKRDTKIDNLVQIGHDVQIGERCIIVGQAGLAGFVVLEDDVSVGGQAGIAPHVRIGAGAQVSAKAGVHSDVKAGQVVSGIPAVPHMEFLRQFARRRRG